MNAATIAHKKKISRGGPEKHRFAQRRRGRIGSGGDDERGSQRPARTAEMEGYGRRDGPPAASDGAGTSSSLRLFLGRAADSGKAAPVGVVPLSQSFVRSAVVPTEGPHAGFSVMLAMAVAATFAASTAAFTATDDDDAITCAGKDGSALELMVWW